MTRITEQRNVSGFHSVDLRGIGKVTVVQGDNEGLTIEAEERTMSKIESVVEDGVLRLGLKLQLGIVRGLGEIDYHVSMREVRGLRVSGSGDIRSERIDGDRLELKVSGAGNIDIDELAARDLAIAISGSGDLTLGGAVERMAVSISGSGKLRAERLACRMTEIKISGAGDANVHASDEMNVQISGAGSVRYIGNPRMNVKKSGIGRVTQIAES